MSKILSKIDTFLTKYSKTILICIIAFQVLFSLLLLIVCGPIIDGDGASYYEPAISFIKTGKMLFEGEPTFFRTPGYILLLSAIYSLTNYSNYAVALVQICFLISITYMIYLLVSDISHKRSYGIVACIFFALDIAFYQQVIATMTDTLFSFLLVLSLFFFYKYLKNNKYKNIFISFFALNYALLTRPQLIYLSTGLNIVLLACFIFKKVKFKVLITYVLLFSIVFGGWSYRNYVQYGTFSYNPLRPRDYYKYYSPMVYEYVNGTSEGCDEYLSNLLYEKYPNYQQLSEPEKVNAKADIGKTYTFKHFGVFITLNFIGLFNEMCVNNLDIAGLINWNETVKSVISKGLSSILLLSYLIYAYFFLIDIKKQTALDWIILLCVMYLMASTAIVGYSRFRMAFYPLSIIGTFIAIKRKITD